MLMAALVAGLVNGTFAVLLTDLFPTRIRFTGVALVFNVAFTLFSGTAPLVATTLIRDTGHVDRAGAGDDRLRRADAAVGGGARAPRRQRAPISRLAAVPASGSRLTDTRTAARG